MTAPATAPIAPMISGFHSKITPRTAASPPPTTAPTIPPPGRHGPAYRSLAASTSRMSTFSRAT